MRVSGLLNLITSKSMQTYLKSIVGCFLGSVATAAVGEQLGRRKSVGAGVIVMIIGALLQATAYTRAHMIVARIVSGFGMGAINSTVPVMQAEFSPKATRGICTSFTIYCSSCI